MEFDTFYQYFIYSKNWAYLLMFITLPAFVVFWNTILYPTKDEEVLKLIGCCKDKIGSATAKATEKMHDIKAKKSK